MNTLLNNLAATESYNKPSWMYNLLGIMILISLLLAIFVPWKKKQLKDPENNKSYSVTSDYILNLTAVEIVTYVAFTSLYIVNYYTSTDICK